ncbi:MAG: sulfotransferase domain-containing protein [Saonia sp.]
MNSIKPNFLIIGAAKSGTTSLFAYLKQHPEIFMPAMKETNYFALKNCNPELNGPGDLNWYKSSITNEKDYLELFEVSETHLVIGEASPTYLHSACAPENIFNFNPDIKLIAILRDPRYRALSYFHHCRRIGIEDMNNFMEVLKMEKERKKRGWYWANHIHAGYYCQQLENYYSYFPKKQIKVILLEDLIKFPKETIKGVFSFLEVNQFFEPKMDFIANRGYKTTLNILEKTFLKSQVLNRIVYAISPRLFNETKLKILLNIKMNNRDKQFLTDVYIKEVMRLEILINRNLSHWYS